MSGVSAPLMPTADQHVRSVLMQCETMWKNQVSHDTIFCHYDGTKVSDITMMRRQDLAAFFDQAASSFSESSDRTFLILLAFFAMKHDAYHYGSYELQVLGEVCTRIERGDHILGRMEYLVEQWRRAGFQRPGADFVSSNWWKLYKEAIARHMTFVTKEKDGRLFLRYHSLKQGLERASVNSGV